MRFLLLGMLLSLSTATVARELSVSPEGLSPAEAIRTIRAAKASGERSAWTVHVAPGLYPLTEPLVLTPADSGTPEAPVRWIADKGEAVFSGGRTIGGWMDDGAGVWSAPVPRDVDGKPIWFQSLFVNGRRAVRARHPETGFFAIDAWTQAVSTNAAGEIVYEQHCVVSNAVADALTGLSPRELSAVEWQARVKWSYGSNAVVGWDPATRTVQVNCYGESVKKWKAWIDTEEMQPTLYCLENVRAGFDAPGEWFYDVTAGRLRYRPLPGETIAGSTFLAPLTGLANLLRLEGDPEKGRSVTDVSFKGISFSHTRTEGDVRPDGFIQQYQYQAAVNAGGAIVGRGVCRVVFENCRVSQIDNYGLRFGAGCVSNRIVGCTFDDLGAGGIWIGDGTANCYRTGLEKAPEGMRVPYGDPSTRALHPSAFVTIEDCTVSRAGRVNPEACGIVLANVSDSLVTHCDIHDLYYTGVSVGWSWGYKGSFAQRNTIAFNHIYDIGKCEMADMGGVYTLGTSFGTCISNNVIHSIDSVSYGGWGLYNDEGSEGIVMENNLVYGTKDASYHLHFGRNNVVRNNILVNARKCQLAVSKPEDHLSVMFERNIIAWDYDGAAYREPMWMRGIVDGTAKTAWTNNLFWCSAGPTVINAPHPAIVADPRFADPAHHDYRLKGDSPALRYGFRPWDLSQSGRLSVK